MTSRQYSLMLPLPAISVWVMGMLLWLSSGLSPGEPAVASADTGGLQLLEELQSVITKLAERVQPSVVSVGALRPKDA